MKTYKINFEYPVIFPRLCYELLESGVPLMVFGHDQSDKELLKLVVARSAGHDNIDLPDVAFLNTNTGKWEYLSIDTGCDYYRISKGKAGSFILAKSLQSQGLDRDVNRLLLINTILMYSSCDLRLIHENIYRKVN